MTTANTLRKCSVLAAALALTVTACGTNSLEGEDPAGHQACFEYVVKPYEDVPEADLMVVVLGGNSFAAEHALESSTLEIRAAAEETSAPAHGLFLADGDALVAACAENGYEIAEHSPAWWKEQSG